MVVQVAVYQFELWFLSTVCVDDSCILCVCVVSVAPHTYKYIQHVCVFHVTSSLWLPCFHAIAVHPPLIVWFVCTYGSCLLCSESFRCLPQFRWDDQEKIRKKLGNGDGPKTKGMLCFVCVCELDVVCEC